MENKNAASTESKIVSDKVLKDSLAPKEPLRAKDSEAARLAQEDNQTAAVIKKVFVVLNPVSGLTNADTARDLVTSFCQDQGWDCDLHETKKDEDLRKLVRDQIKKGVDLVIVSGGDGTVSAVVSGMAKSKVPLAILPAGTGNALARDLNIPLSLEAAVGLLGEDFQVRVMDVMEVKNDAKTDYFALNVSVGISAETMRETKRNEKRRFGMLAYLYRAIGIIKGSRMHRFEVNVDGKRYLTAASEVMIANTKLLGLEPRLEDVNIDPNDGRLDLFLVRAQGFRAYLSVFFDFLIRRHTDETKNLDYLPITQTAQIRSQANLPVQADGEVIGATPVDVTLIPSALHIIVPVPKKDNK